ncbi:TlpA family protein disulfide reductase [Mumia zhuanghuii]|uniref:TlpA family protein disulfide reductase n=1 Tax=Mumia zhuanghuii TaxID=2585211 RepID=A0A5C4MFM2_9ACTN|nr:TlpA disulfide reductase family protein [Mumia zhuanghuii]TNC41001.1 TlpA family protein disulfide reductase [Mumia zhuanghuii]
MSVARLVAAAAAAVLLPGCSSSTQADETTGGFVAGDGSITLPKAAEREPAPELAGESLDGERLSLADFAGKTVVVNVWGSWCAECRVEAPVFAAVDAQTGDDVQFLGINIRDSRAAAKAYDENFGITYPSLFDPSGRTVLGFRDSLPSMAVPTTWVIAPDGTVAARTLGSVSEATLRGLIDEARTPADG